jgi:hypothetical protein
MRKPTRMSWTERVIEWLHLVSEGSGRIWKPLAWPLKFLVVAIVTAAGQRILQLSGLTYADLPVLDLVPWAGVNRASP